MKTDRQNEILRLIENEEIETQEELANRLREIGFKVTQATVSRDIKDLRLIRQSDYRYAKPGRHELQANDRMIRLLSDSTLSVDYSGQMIVIKTLSGSANVAAEAIDTMNWKEVLGTIAGDNTIFLAVKNENDTAEIADRIRKLAGKE